MGASATAPGNKLKCDPNGFRALAGNSTTPDFTGIAIVTFHHHEICVPPDRGAVFMPERLGPQETITKTRPPDLQMDNSVASTDCVKTNRLSPFSFVALDLVLDLAADFEDEHGKEDGCGTWTRVLAHSVKTALQGDLAWMQPSGIPWRIFIATSGVLRRLLVNLPT